MSSLTYDVPKGILAFQSRIVKIALLFANITSRERQAKINVRSKQSKLILSDINPHLLSWSVRFYQLDESISKFTDV